VDSQLHVTPRYFFNFALTSQLGDAAALPVGFYLVMARKSPTEGVTEMISSLLIATALFYMQPATPADALPIANDAWIAAPILLSSSDEFGGAPYAHLTQLSPSDQEELLPPKIRPPLGQGGIGSDYVAGLKTLRQHANPIGTDGTTFADRWGGLREIYENSGVPYARTITYWGQENPSGPLCIDQCRPISLAQQLGIDEVGMPSMHPDVKPATHPTTAEWRTAAQKGYAENSP
jgi:hypothetical protein